MPPLRTWAPDLILTGAPLIGMSGAMLLRMTFGKLQSGTDLLTSSSTVSVNLVNDAGTAVIAAPVTATLDDVSTIAATWIASVTPTAALDPAQIYRAVWTWTISNDEATPRTLAGVTVLDQYPSKYPQRETPLTESWITLCNPGLGTAPANIGWRGPIARAWYELALWVVRQRRGDLWTISEITGPLEHLALHYIWRASASYGNPSALVNAATARTAYDLALKDVQMGWDTDGDGDVDKIAGAAGSATDSGAVV